MALIERAWLFRRNGGSAWKVCENERMAEVYRQDGYEVVEMVAAPQQPRGAVDRIAQLERALTMAERWLPAPHAKAVRDVLDGTAYTESRVSG